MKISSVLPIYNGETHLRAALDSFFAQEYPNKELVIVDGKSTDGTHAILEEYQARYPSEILWVKEEDRNLSHARNLGIQAATGDIIGFLAADDLLHKGVFEDIAYYAAQAYFDVIYFSQSRLQ